MTHRRQLLAVLVLGAVVATAAAVISGDRPRT
jgi:hypothetical protein